MCVRFHDQASALGLDLDLAERVYRSLLPKRLTAAGIDVVTRAQPFNAKLVTLDQQAGVENMPEELKFAPRRGNRLPRSIE